MGQDGFTFDKLIGKRFRCTKTMQWIQITADDEDKATSGNDGHPYWDVPCPEPGCGGFHRFWHKTNNHRPGKAALAPTAEA